jgi:hypothetical protein
MKLNTIFLYLMVAACGAVVAYTVINVSGVGVGSPSSQGNVVLVDMLQVEVAQRKYVKKVLGTDASVGSLAAAFRASGDVVAASRQVAPNANIAVKQSFLHSNHPDITNQVISALGYPPVSDEELGNALNREAVLGQFKTDDVVNPLNQDKKPSSSVQMPY